ncbi:PP2C family protein-serine/threonine phosphatase [Chitinilyticum piscinae]|uniref:Serine/threonine-protein phosphatase n=1 Tax=Chitinilyticum piscinae TaxID=2866724 RepID=A0A8J7FLY3_9NEIS|nr:protein phosphatase 2C domain-containing protein [Chitinilyticum piscinae]MBE9610332.1 serine/threonine-protein phosphatase [Chitinilyticum piscinae]
MKFTVYQDSRQGGRKYNQDRVGYSYSRDSLLLVVADGMGGHLHGEVAAQIVVQLLSDQFQQKADPIIHRPLEFLEDGLMKCHDAIYNYASNHHLLEIPRTTAVACIVQDGMAYWAHVGDSRLYLIRKETVVAMTRDHSKVRKLLDSGAITAAEAAVHPERNKIYNCLGGTLTPEVEVGGKIPLHDGDAILLCTDGFWGSTVDAELTHFMSSFPVLFAVPQLMDRAEFRGGKYGDNLTALAINWHEDIEPAELGEESMISTQKLDAHTISTHVDPLSIRQVSDITDDDIERAIQEIQSAIAKYSK